MSAACYFFSWSWDRLQLMTCFACAIYVGSVPGDLHHCFVVDRTIGVGALVIKPFALSIDVKVPTGRI